MQIEYNGYTFIAINEGDHINVIITKDGESFGEHNFYEDISLKDAIDKCKGCVD